MGSYEIWFWAEFLSLNEIEKLCPNLAEHGYGLHLRFGVDQLSSEAASSLAKICDEIPIKLWVLIPRSKGYFLNLSNLEIWIRSVSRIVEWIQQNCLEIDWIIADLEPSLGIFPLRLHHPSELARAARMLTQLILELNSEGMKILATTIPMLLDSHGYQRLLGLPLYGIPWNEVSFMVYRSMLNRYFPLGSYLVYSYGMEAISKFGKRACLDIGTTADMGITGFERGYGDFSELEEDLSAGLGAGLNKMHIYSLEGILARGWMDRLGRLAQLEPMIPDPDIFSLGLRSFSKVLGKAWELIL